MKFLILFLLFFTPYTYADAMMREGRYGTNFSYCGLEVYYDPESLGLIAVTINNPYNSIICNQPGMVKLYQYNGEQNTFRWDRSDSDPNDPTDDGYYCVIKPVSTSRFTQACYWRDVGSLINVAQYFRY